MTEEKIGFDKGTENEEALRLLPLNRLEDAFGLNDAAYYHNSFDRLTPEAIDAFEVTPGYRSLLV